MSTSSWIYNLDFGVQPEIDRDSSNVDNLTLCFQRFDGQPGARESNAERAKFTATRTDHSAGKTSSEPTRRLPQQTREITQQIQW